MATAHRFSVISLTVAAGDVQYIHTNGDFVACIESDQTSFQLSLDDLTAFYFAKGIERQLADGETFKLVRVDNPNGSPLTVTLAIGYGRYIDRRVTLSGGVQDAGADTFRSTADVTLAATATTQIVAADSNRREAIITNLGAETLRIGDSNAGAARGTPLVPNATLVVSTKAAIYGYNPGGAGVDVALTETVNA